MRFFVLDEGEPRSSERRTCLLEPVSWPDDDYLTLYRLWFADGRGALDELGRVKIGYADLVRNDRPLQKREFHQLADLDRRLDWFSVGQDVTYYDNLARLDARTRREILRALCDIAFDSRIFKQAVFWDVTQTSLLRSVEPQSVEGQFRRIARGGDPAEGVRLRIRDAGGYRRPAAEAVFLGHAALPAPLQHPCADRA